MRCPFCQFKETKVVDKRDVDSVTRRRRECLKCQRRFTTYERVILDLKVIKKDGSRQPFDIEKIRKGIEKACEKRAISSEQIEKIISETESKIYKITNGKEIESKNIGEIVMDKLKKVDKVAYIRFASVYREFADIDDFKEELKNLSAKK
ncbi:MAG: transcriptional regulator NrdR [Candidatus Pacearchaeota archaeon]